jgi:ferrochelatase
VKRVAVLTPSFAADCLETLEEIAIRGRRDFVASGGEDLTLVPCVNAEPSWAEAVAAMARGRSGGAHAFGAP